ncbi:hypothetical protein NRB16_24660 [Pseudomonas sp. LJDD11]|uniref:hypothetical protein n=1 Tax=Pseudomonas sp. LJDD11 TaxID=2931984 RepID=UPI00211C1831|nr:hypothetical protein [Pseudomonas sp. LJDD11]MCQ9426716.1 hypothetical protein [Pseudomonas sp. LJDD11]
MNTETINIRELPDEIELIKLPKVRRLTGVSTTKIYQMTNNGLLPAQTWPRSSPRYWSGSVIALHKRAAKRSPSRSPLEHHKSAHF